MHYFKCGIFMQWKQYDESKIFIFIFIFFDSMVQHKY